MRPTGRRCGDYARHLESAGTDNQNLDVVLRSHVHNVGQVQTGACAGQTQIDIKGRRSDDKAVVGARNKAAAGLLKPASVELFAAFIGCGQVVRRDGCGGLRVRAMTRPNQPRVRGSPTPASRSSPTATIRILRCSTEFFLLQDGPAVRGGRARGNSLHIWDKRLRAGFRT